MKKTSPLILRNSLLFFVTIFVFCSMQATAQTKLASPRISQAISEANLVPMHVKVHPLARPEFDRGVVADSQPMNRMLLLLQRSPDQETALRNLMDEQQTKNSPNFHAWLTPQQFGQQFGVADADVQKVTDWLTQKGFTGIKVGPGHMVIEFSGTAGLVRNAFHTDVHNFMVKGEAHMANVSVPQMPAALAPVVAGVVSLHNFRKKSFTHFSEAAARAKAEGKLRPGFTAAPCSSLGPGPCFAMGPADFAKIYNIPTGSLDGTGQTIALVARSNINVQDINDYGNGFNVANLKAFTAASNVVLNGPDPGIVSGDDEEATLDVEASGGVAPKATILLVVSSSSLSLFADGVDLSAIYIVENNLAPVMSESFGLCEAFANNGFDLALWEQAAAQGITVMVSSGDNGSAACDAADPANNILAASNGLNVSGTASTPFNIAVGGTDFDDATTLGTYWNSSNSGTGLLSAKSYIPEVPWNDTCAAAGSLTGCTSPLDPNGLDLVGGSGGQSSCSNQNNTGACLGGYAKPSWQTGVGVPADTVRDIPDVSLFASDGNGHASGNFWVICYAGVAGSSQQNGQPCNLTGPAFNFTGVGGTSASSPAFAGIMALIDQKTGSREGNANYVFYKLATLQAASPGNGTCNSNGASLPASTCTFNDVTKGNNSVACNAGSFNCSNTGTTGFGVLVEPAGPNPPFSATTPAWRTTTGYDLATGLGSVNVTNLANNWANATGAFVTTTTTINSPVSGLTITHGATQSFTIKVTPTTATGDVSIIASPTGSPQMAISNGNLLTGSATLAGGTATFTTNNLPGGTSYPIVAHYGGDGTAGPSDSAAITITVNKEPSQVAATLQIEDPAGGVASTAPSTPYGNGYFLRVDVTNTTSGGQPCSANALPCPTGTITLSDNGSPLNNFLHTGGANSNSALLNNEGFAEDLFLASTGLAGGSHSLTSTYAGDNSYTASTQTAPNVITITPAGIGAGVTANGQTAVTVTTGQSVTLLATATGFNLIKDSTGATDTVGSKGAGPTGTIAFKNGATTIATVPVVGTAFNASNGTAFATASTTTTFSTTGMQTITALFTSADGNYASCLTASAVQPPCSIAAATVTVTAAGTFAVAYSPTPLVLSSATGTAAAETVTVTPAGGFTGTIAVTPTASSLPPGVGCTPSPLNINVVSATPVNSQFMCTVTATSTTLTASNVREDRMQEAKAIPPTTGGKGWWALSAGTGFAALFLLFLPGGRKKYRAALGLGLVCIFTFTMGCNGGGSSGTNKTATVTKLTVTSGKVASGTNFSFSVAVTGGTPAGMVQLFDNATAIGTPVAVSGGSGTPTATGLTVGTHSISAHYLGDTTTLASASGSLNLTVTGGTTIAITTSPAATPVAAAINITIQ
jgi:hypothetical protein